MEKPSVEKPRSDWEIGLRESAKDHAARAIKDLIRAYHVLRPEDREWGREYIAKQLDQNDVKLAKEILGKLTKSEPEQ